MKAVTYIGLVIFAVGIVLFFLRIYDSQFIASIDQFYIDMLWPIGMIIYSIGLIFQNKEKKQKSQEQAID